MIFGIDIGTRWTGIAYIEENCIFTDTISADDGFYGKMGLINLANKIVKRIKNNNPEYVVFENYGYKRGFVNVEVGELAGMIMYQLSGGGYKILFVSPQTVKKMATGYGRSKKKEVANAVKELYGVTVDSYHESDAVAICHVLQLFLGGELDEESTDRIKRRMFSV